MEANLPEVHPGTPESVPSIPEKCLGPSSDLFGHRKDAEVFTLTGTLTLPRLAAAVGPVAMAAAGPK